MHIMCGVCVCLQLTRLEACLLRSERERVQECESVFKVRAEANSKFKHLRANIQVRHTTWLEKIAACSCMYILTFIL